MFAMFACISLIAFTVALDKDNKKEDVQVQSKTNQSN